VRLSTAITLEDVPPLELVEATPDSVWFAGPESVTEAFARDRALAADGLGEALTGEAYFFPFEVRWRIEDCRIIAATGGSEQPFLWIVRGLLEAVLVLAG
jgi:hypothetical protein